MTSISEGDLNDVLQNIVDTYIICHFLFRWVELHVIWASTGRVYKAACNPPNQQGILNGKLHTRI